jgi:chaperonin cofactor prefoldin
MSTELIYKVKNYEKDKERDGDVIIFEDMTKRNKPPTLRQLVLEGFEKINSRIDVLEKRMDTFEKRLDTMENKFDKRFNGIESRLTKLEVEVEKIKGVLVRNNLS